MSHKVKSTRKPDVKCLAISVRRNEAVRLKIDGTTIWVVFSDERTPGNMTLQFLAPLDVEIRRECLLPEAEQRDATV